LTVPVMGEAHLYQNKTVMHTGLLLELPGWLYPVIINTDTGKAKFDNYNEQWGKQVELDKFMVAYSISVTELQLGAEGYSLDESTLNLVNEAGETEEWTELIAESYS